MTDIFAVLLGLGFGLLCCIVIYILHTAFGEFIDYIIYKRGIR